jgi:hypothetical protein
MRQLFFIQGWMNQLMTAPHVRVRFISHFQRTNWAKEDWEQRNSFVSHHSMTGDEFDVDGSICNRACGDCKHVGGDKASAPGSDESYNLWVAGLVVNNDTEWGYKKGAEIFWQLADRMPSQRFVMYGSGLEGEDTKGNPDMLKRIRELESRLDNFEFRGELARGKKPGDMDEHTKVFCGARTLVMPTQVHSVTFFLGNIHWPLLPTSPV